eukprot:759030-Hanusia_phi.AAC.2
MLVIHYRFLNNLPTSFFVHFPSTPAHLPPNPVSSPSSFIVPLGAARFFSSTLIRLEAAKRTSVNSLLVFVQLCKILLPAQILIFPQSSASSPTASVDKVCWQQLRKRFSPRSTRVMGAGGAGGFHLGHHLEGRLRGEGAFLQERLREA